MSKAAVCPMESMPAANPLVTVIPCRLSSPAKSLALSLPPAVGFRLPMTATCGCHRIFGSPSTYSAAGGEGISRSSGGNCSLSQVRRWCEEQDNHSRSRLINASSGLCSASIVSSPSPARCNWSRPDEMSPSTPPSCSSQWTRLEPPNRGARLAINQFLCFVTANPLSAFSSPRTQLDFRNYSRSSGCRSISNSRTTLEPLMTMP